MNNTQEYPIELPQMLDTCNSIKDILSTVKELHSKNISVCWCNEQISLDILMKFVSLLEDVQQKQLIRQQELQRIGIRNALQNKKQGKGKYGRPKIPVPDDFAEVVRYHRENGLSLNTYRESLGMTSSTFYKRLNELEDKRKHTEP